MIVFDIGNSDTVIGFHDADNLVEVFRIPSLKNESSVYFEYRILNFMLEKDLKKEMFSKAVISSVVPILTPFFVFFCKKFLEIPTYVVNPKKSKLLSIDIEMPEELGSDLFLNALAASTIYKENCIIVDFGTALTFTCVSSEKVILGVTILPGIKTAIKSLFSGTSLLPEVKISKPATIIGKNSMHAIQAGIVFGYESMVTGIIEKIKLEIGGNCKVIATGGLSSSLSFEKQVFDKIDKNLTIYGLLLYGKAQE